MSSERDESFLSKRKKKGGQKAGKFELFWHRECVGPKQTLELIWHLNLLDLNLPWTGPLCILLYSRVGCVAEFGSLTAAQLMEKVRGLQNLAYQLGLDEGGLVIVRIGSSIPTWAG